MPIRSFLLGVHSSTATRPLNIPRPYTGSGTMMYLLIMQLVLVLTHNEDRSQTLTETCCTITRLKFRSHASQPCMKLQLVTKLTSSDPGNLYRSVSAVGRWSAVDPQRKYRR